MSDETDGYHPSLSSLSSSQLDTLAENLTSSNSTDISLARIDDNQAEPSRPSSLKLHNVPSSSSSAPQVVEQVQCEEHNNQVPIAEDTPDIPTSQTPAPILNPSMPTPPIPTTSYDNSKVKRVYPTPAKRKHPPGQSLFKERFDLDGPAHFLDFAAPLGVLPGPKPGPKGADKDSENCDSQR